MKLRLDQILLERQMAKDIESARKLIMAGQVYVDNLRVDKVGTLIKPGSVLTLNTGSAYVTRGGDKLAPALKHFNLGLKAQVAIDLGASHGGFTDCLLKHGVALVYAVDVGKGLLDFALRNDPRVRVMEQVNARELHKLPAGHFEPAPTFAVCDLSFISLRMVIQPLIAVLARPAQLLMLVKPQFELEARQVSKGGVVEDAALHEQACQGVIDYCETLGLSCLLPYASPVRGLKKGNQEFFILAQVSK